MCAESLKTLGNEQFINSLYAEAADTYTQIVEQSAPQVPDTLLRIAHANRAACYLELGNCQRAVSDCSHILQHLPSTSPDDASIMLKVYFRLGKGYHNLGMHDEAIEQLNTCRRLYGSSAAETKLRHSIFEAQGATDKAKKEKMLTKANGPERKRFDGSKGYLGIRYTVEVVTCGRTPGCMDEDRFIYFEDWIDIPANKDGREVEKLIGKTERRYNYQTICRMPWMCRFCGRRADSMLHDTVNQLSWTAGELRFVDIAQPICKKGGCLSIELPRIMKPIGFLV